MSLDQGWTLPHAPLISILHWEDGCVLYDALKTSTTLLSPLAGEIISRLRDGAADTRTLASLPDVPDAESLAGLLEDLAAHGLIRRLD